MSELIAARSGRALIRTGAGLALCLALAGCGAGQPASQNGGVESGQATPSATILIVDWGTVPPGGHPGHGGGARPISSTPATTAGTGGQLDAPSPPATGAPERSPAPSHTPTDTAAEEPSATTVRPQRSPTGTRVPPTEPLPSATSAPDPEQTEPQPQPIGRGITWYSDSGETTTDEVELAPGLLIVHIEHQAATPFAIYLMNSAGDHLALLANHTTPVSGMRAYGIGEAGRYYLHVIGQDGWRAGMEQPGGTLGHLPGELTGSGPRVVAPRSFAAGTHTLAWSHEGALAFEVRLLTPDGRRVAAPVVSSGPGQGSTTLELAEGEYLVDVAADGPWSISVSS